MKRITWDPEKNKKLKRERGVSFEEVLLAIENGGLMTIEKVEIIKYLHGRGY